MRRKVRIEFHIVFVKEGLFPREIFTLIFSQEQVCEMYRTLHGECPQLVPNFESLILEFVRDIRNRQNEHERLEKTYQRCVFYEILSVFQNEPKTMN